MEVYDAEGLKRVRWGPGKPWPDFESTVADPNFPKKGIESSTELWKAMTVVPVDHTTPVIDLSMVKGDDVKDILSMHIPKEPNYSKEWPELPRIRRMVAIFSAFKVRSMFQMKAAEYLVGPESSSELRKASAQSFEQVTDQKETLVEKWREELAETDLEEQSELECELKKIAAGWRQWAFV